jgi:secretion/DNA translocation related TadE-like protein
VLVLAMLGVLTVAMAAALALGGAVLAKARAQAVADLAALAGAQAVLDRQGTTAACVQARAIARAHGGRLSTCVADDSGRCEVVVERAAPAVVWQVGSKAQARAVAGSPERLPP